ncbi:hypothetical protein [Martelella soudanensis]|uniref:hypothetical protein n=1 Tax=unclassified Martelella TaxID=2629616 RepID=UPI001FEE10F9|nr:MULTISPECIES: hypothetical protein [unclassified Martelella]
MTDKTLFPVPQDDTDHVTRYVPDDWVDEACPEPHADPNDFLCHVSGSWSLVAAEMEETWEKPVTHGDLIRFCSFRDYGSGKLSVRADMSWETSFSYPDDANYFYVDFDHDTAMTSIEDVIRCQMENDPDCWTPPYEIDISVAFFGETTTFRVVIEEGSARLDRLPEPPLTMPYTNWRGETAIRNLRPIAVKFTATSWHKEPQWILDAYDYARQEVRGFALKDFGPAPFQPRVDPWMQACFGPKISADRLERGDRLIEEVLELLQAVDYPRERIKSLMDYTWSKPKGEPAQEVGGVMVTLAAFCLAYGLDMHDAGETELARVWTMVEIIRAKQAAKPTGSALPQAWPSGDDSNG